MRIRAVIAAIALGAALISAPPAQAAVTAPTPVVDGNRLIDTRTGEVFTPHGANWPGFEYACVQGWGYSGSFSADQAAAIASWGINVIRLPLNQSCWLGLPGTNYGGGRSAIGYQTAVHSWVDMLNAAGVAVLLDLHWSAPAGVAATGQRAMADAQSVTFWSSVAGSFASNRSVMFDLFNEPYSRWNNATNSWAFQLTWDCWQSGGCLAPAVDDTQPLTSATYPVAGMTALVAAVRDAGAPQPVWLGGLNYSNDLTGWLAHRPADTQLVASWHNYIGQGCHTLSCWNSQIAPVSAVVPVVATEFGQNSSSTSAGYMEGFMTWADEHGIGYMPWAWWDVPYSEDHGNSNYALINSDFSPKAPNGTAYHAHLAALTPPTAPVQSSVAIAVSPSTTTPGARLSVTVTATVPGTANPRGGISLYVDGYRLGTWSPGTAAQGTLVLTPVAPATAGNHSYSATYTGTTGEVSSTSPTATLAVAPPAGPTATTTALTLTPTTAAPGARLAATVKVAVAGTPNPRGGISLYADGYKLGTWNLGATAGGTFRLTPLASAVRGTHKYYATYTGTAGQASSSSATVILTVR